MMMFLFLEGIYSRSRSRISFRTELCLSLSLSAHVRVLLHILNKVMARQGAHHPVRNLGTGMTSLVSAIHCLRTGGRT
jgi:hypothetical protein